MRANSSGVTEKAEFKIDQDKYAEGWERVFGKKEKVHTEDCALAVNVRHGCTCNGYNKEEKE